MKYSKRLWLWFALFIITGIGAFLSIQLQNENTSSSTAFPQLSIKDTAAIYSVSFQKQQSLLFLKKQLANQWVVNQKYNARPQLIQMLMFGLNKLEVKYPIAPEDKSQWISKIKKNAILVDIKGDDLNKTFYLLSNPTDPNSSVYSDIQFNNIYIVNVPGVKGELSSLLGLGESEWRNKTIFNSSVYSIHSISLNYWSAKNDNFDITFQDNIFSISQLPKADTIKLKKYLSLIPILAVDKYLNASEDSIKVLIQQAKPYARFVVEDDIINRSETLNLYFTKDNKYMLAQIKSSQEWATISPQMWRFALVPRRFFELKQE